MKLKSRISKICLVCITVPFLALTSQAFAKNGLMSEGAYDRGYDHGYDDGYEDCMDECPCPPSTLLGGLYLGAGLGYEGLQINRNPWINDDKFGRFHTHANGGFGRLTGGYDHYFSNHLYLAGEIFGTLSGATGKDSLTNPVYDGKVSVNGSWGASILPGYKSSAGPVVFGRFGYIQTDFTVKDSSNNVSNSTSQWVSGFNTGIGFQFPLNKQFSTRLEYDYIKYRDFKNNGTTGSSNNSTADARGSIDFLFRF